MKNDKNIVVIAHNIRSALNVGSMFRICDGAGVKKLYLTGYTPYPRVKNDKRLNFEIENTEKKIKKSGLDGFKHVSFEHVKNLQELIIDLKKENFEILALEESKDSKNIYDYTITKNSAIIVGNEVEGIEESILNLSDEILKIPMLGKGKSLNVGVSLGIGIYLLKR